MQAFKVAILDMYKGEPNQGMRNIHEILNRYAEEKEIEITKEVFDIRLKHHIPNLEFDAYISTGGPGSPVDIEGWEDEYLKFVYSLILHNENSSQKKMMFLICHSFQIYCHHFKLGNVCKRISESFGIFPMHKTSDGNTNKFTKLLAEPFYAVDSRKWQVIQPDLYALDVMGAKILALEKERPNIPFERAIMAVQFTPEIIGTQFHPEADADGMKFYLKSEEKKKVVIDNYGQEKYDSMMAHLDDEDKIPLTQKHMIPVFLDEALQPHLSTVHSYDSIH